ncbi:hypothetical protein AMECASPLE_038334, partial [Ameca splendens]
VPSGTGRRGTEGHQCANVSCWQTDITLQTGSKSVIRSRDHMQQRSSPNESGFPPQPGKKGWDRIARHPACTFR